MLSNNTLKMALKYSLTNMLIYAILKPRNQLNCKDMKKFVIFTLCVILIALMASSCASSHKCRAKGFDGKPAKHWQL